MKRLSQGLSLLGLMMLVAAVVSFISQGPEGIVLRWGRLGLFLLGALASFVAAARLGRD